MLQMWTKTEFSMTIRSILFNFDDKHAHLTNWVKNLVDVMDVDENSGLDNNIQHWKDVQVILDNLNFVAIMRRSERQEIRTKRR